MLLTAWPQVYDESFIPLTDALLEEGVTLYVCTVQDEDSNLNTANLLEGRAGVVWLDCAVDTVWVRDWGPFFLEGPDGRVLGDSHYAGNRPNDNHYPTELGGEHFDAPVHEVPLSLDGGNILPLEDGRCLSSTTVYERHELDPDETAGVLEQTLGCRDTAWLQPIEWEVTGHVDVHALPLPDGRVLSGLQENQPVLASWGLEAVAFPRPPVADLDGDGEDDHATFLNAVWVGEGTLLVPVYEAWSEESEEAVERLEDLLGSTRIVPVPADPLIIDGGAIHCVVKPVFVPPVPPAPDPLVDAEPLHGCSTSTPVPSGGWALLGLMLSTWRGRRRLRRRRRPSPFCAGCAGHA